MGGKPVQFFWGQWHVTSDGILPTRAPKDAKGKSIVTGDSAVSEIGYDRRHDNYTIVENDGAIASTIQGYARQFLVESIIKLLWSSERARNRNGEMDRIAG